MYNIMRNGNVPRKCKSHMCIVATPTNSECLTVKTNNLRQTFDVKKSVADVLYITSTEYSVLAWKLFSMKFKGLQLNLLLYLFSKLGPAQF
jgi:hypothetical protein